MKLQRHVIPLFTISLLSIAAQAFSEYDPLEAREWTDDIFIRHDNHHTPHRLIPGNDMVAALTTRELVGELESRLYQRGGTPAPNPSSGGTVPFTHHASDLALDLPWDSSPEDDHPVVVLPKVHDPNKQPKKSAMKNSQVNGGQAAHDTQKKVVLGV